MIGVLVVDDQALIRTAIANLIAPEGDIELLGTASNGIEAVRRARELRPDVVVMDVRMPMLDGIEATRMIVSDAELKRVKVLILTTFDDDPDFVVRGVQSGASGFIGKATDPEVLVAAIRTVHEGEGQLSPRATKHLLARHTGRTGREGVHPDLARLTQRELDVLRLVAAGRTNQEIALELGITEATAKTHLNRTMAKVSLHDRAQLVVLAYETGLITPRYR